MLQLWDQFLSQILKLDSGKENGTGWRSISMKYQMKSLRS
ncbi:hypothetical protein OIU78_014769, partial [Salix suchowensis]